MGDLRIIANPKEQDLQDSKDGWHMGDDCRWYKLVPVHGAQAPEAGEGETVSKMEMVGALEGRDYWVKVAGKFETELNAANFRIGELEAEVSIARMDLDKAKRRIEELESKGGDLAYATWKRHDDALTETRERLEQNWSEARAERDEARTALEECHDALEAKQGEIDGLEAEVERLKGEMAGLYSPEQYRRQLFGKEAAEADNRRLREGIEEITKSKSYSPSERRMKERLRALLDKPQEDGDVCNACANGPCGGLYAQGCVHDSRAEVERLKHLHEHASMARDDFKLHFEAEQADNRRLRLVIGDVLEDEIGDGLFERLRAALDQPQEGEKKPRFHSRDDCGIREECAAQQKDQPLRRHLLDLL
jgi:DNA repair exonuclease SbcCD ATPase subunit